ncbi:MAG: hypothetical protein ABI740_01270, partial [Alphaproteobacteria bacterium]
MTDRFRPLLIACAALLAACESPPNPSSSQAAASAPPPAFLKDKPDEVNNGLPVNFTQAHAGDAAPPNPLVDQSGKPIMRAKDWTGHRRQEVLNLLHDNQYGRGPNRTFADRTLVKKDEDLALGGLARRQQITVLDDVNPIDVVL